MVLKYEDIQPTARLQESPAGSCPWRQDDGGGSELSEGAVGEAHRHPPMSR